MPGNCELALHRLYEAHDEDPNRYTASSREQIPYETHYARKMELYLQRRAPAASELLRLAICGQHFRRWEVPRSDFPMTKLGYHSWRTQLKKRQAELVGNILLECGYVDAEVAHCRALIEKQGLAQGGEDSEVQVLEDVACLVFLDDQFAEFQQKHDADKIIGIVRKTWSKMSPKGREMATQLQMSEECKALVEKALAS